MTSTSPATASTTEPQRKKAVNPTLQLVAGFTAGTMSTIVLQPLDLVKIRFQLDRSYNLKELASGQRPSETPRHTTLNTMKTIYRTEGGVRGLYRGIGPSFLGSSLSWGIYFWLYAHTKQMLYTSLHSDDTDFNAGGKPKLSAWEHLVASSLSGTMTACVANPCFVVKTRYCATSRFAEGAYTNVLGAFKTIFETEGMRGLYRGIVPAMFGVSHGAVQFMAYEELKKSQMFNQQRTIDYLTMASVSKVFATLVTYPYQVVKSRIQSSTDVTIRQEVRSMLAKEGFFGFYKGLGPNIIRVLPGTCITFGVYEFMTKLLESEFNM